MPVAELALGEQGDEQGERAAQPPTPGRRPNDRDRRSGAHGGGPGRRSARIPLAFDHATVLADGLDRARSKIEYTPLATAFLAEEFTVIELRAVYEAVWGAALHTGNFHRKVLSVPGFVESTGDTTARGSARGGPRARLYRAGDARLLHPDTASGPARSGTPPVAVADAVGAARAP